MNGPCPICLHYTTHAAMKTVLGQIIIAHFTLTDQLPLWINHRVLREVMSMAKSTHTTYLNNCSHSMCRNSILFTWYQLFAKSIIMCCKRSKFTNTNYKYKCWYENEYVVNVVCNVIDQFSAKYIDTV